MNAREELELRRSVKEAQASGNSAAELQARRALKAYLSMPKDTPSPVQDIPIGDWRTGIIEPVMTMASGAVSMPYSGLRGLGTWMATGSPEAAAQTVEEVQQDYTYQPRTVTGRAGLTALGKAIDPLGIFQEVGQQYTESVIDPTLEAYGPGAATAARIGPEALAELTGLLSLKGLKQGAELVTSQGEPTLLLKKALDSKGLIYENLKPEVKELIPRYADQKFFNSPQGQALQQAESTAVQQIKAGGKESGLAPFQVVDDELRIDPLAKEALENGFNNGVVQTIKTSNPDTRKAMKEMVRLRQAISRDDSLALRFRPSNVVGDSLTKRVSYIRDLADQERKKLNQLANSKLVGYSVDADKVVNELFTALDELGVTYSRDGRPVLDFTGSDIQKDRTSQKVIQDAIDLLATGKPTALRAHKLKRQLDQMIDYRKKSPMGLTDAGKKVVKRLRRVLNEVVNDVSPEYAEINQKLSKAITVLDDFDNATARKIDITSDSALGQEMRKLMSNYQSRDELMTTATNLADFAAEMGYKGKDDFVSLAYFANELDDRFGAVAKTSLKGQQKAAIEEALDPSKSWKAKATEYAVEKGKGVVGLRKGDFEAYEALFKLLKRE